MIDLENRRKAGWLWRLKNVNLPGGRNEEVRRLSGTEPGWMGLPFKTMDGSSALMSKGQASKVING